LEKCEQKEEAQEKHDEVAKDESGEILNEHVKEQVVERWSEYFELLLNVDDERKVNLTTSMGRGGAASRKVREQMEIKRHELERTVNGSRQFNGNKRHELERRMKSMRKEWNKK
jgi:hypothetical protein